jgi:RNA polymerase sigma factor (sigma-70 family)
MLYGLTAPFGTVCAVPLPAMHSPTLSPDGLSPTGLSPTGLSPTGPELETQLMARFRDAAEPRIFEALYRLAAPAFLQWARARGVADPEELLQDTFVNIYRYARSFRDEAGMSFRNWSHSIAVNLLRRAAVRRARKPVQALEEQLLEPRDPRRGPAETYLCAQEALELRSAWVIVLTYYREAAAELGERDRAALDAVEVRGLCYAEAAAELGVGLSSLKMILFRARKRIRDHIQLRMQAADRARLLAG